MHDSSDAYQLPENIIFKTQWRIKHFSAINLSRLVVLSQLFFCDSHNSLMKNWMEIYGSLKSHIRSFFSHWCVCLYLSDGYEINFKFFILLLCMTHTVIAMKTPAAVVFIPSIIVICFIFIGAVSDWNRDERVSEFMSERRAKFLNLSLPKQHFRCIMYVI